MVDSNSPENPPPVDDSPEGRLIADIQAACASAGAAGLDAVNAVHTLIASAAALMIVCRYSDDIIDKKFERIDDAIDAAYQVLRDKVEQL